MSDIVMADEAFECAICGYRYDPAEDDPDNGVAPGTSFEDLPEDWVCPECGAGRRICPGRIINIKTGDGSQEHFPGMNQAIMQCNPLAPVFCFCLKIYA